MAIPANKLKVVLVLREYRIRQARKYFYEYCRLMLPDIYCSENTHLEKLCKDLQEFYESKTESRLMLNMPPRHGKTLTINLFCEWILGKNVKERIFNVCYNEILSSRSARKVRDDIGTVKINPLEICYNDIFPESRLKQNDKSQSLWSLEGQFFNYLSTSFNASIGGFGATLGIIDDPIKNAEEARNESFLSGQYEWYNNTFRQRLEKGAKVLIITTRWATKDLCGMLLESEYDKWKVISLEACNKSGEMLAPKMFSKSDYEEIKKSDMGHDIFMANYHNTPIDIKGKLYTAFKKYSQIPEFERIINYTDTADQGDDYLCSISAGVYQNELYILNVYYTNQGMEITEPALAEMLLKDKISTAYIESNNGGRGFARAVQRILNEKYNNNKISIQWFTQTKNKQSRILTNSNFVMEHVYFPELWAQRFPEFYSALNSYQSKGKNKHDDAADAITGLAEIIDTIRIMPVEISTGGKRFF